jgi:release factor glutamine methyltransferase
MFNISEILRLATDVLQTNEIPSARFEASALLAFILQKDKTFLIAHPEYILTETEKDTYLKIIERRANREPFQHLTGFQEFYGLNFEVNGNVLIPRPETELIVENAIEILRKVENPKFCEVGVGSGCISISILHEVKKASAIGLDISEKALEVARHNADKHNVLHRLELKISDIFANLRSKEFDLIVSNPPYISNEDVPQLQPEVRDYEPLNALTDGLDGLSIIGQIVRNSPKFLSETAFLLMEIGFGQAVKVEQMFDLEIWQAVEILPDLQGIPRMVRAKLQ